MMNVFSDVIDTAINNWVFKGYEVVTGKNKFSVALIQYAIACVGSRVIIFLAATVIANACITTAPLIAVAATIMRIYSAIDALYLTGLAIKTYKLYGCDFWDGGGKVYPGGATIWKDFQKYGFVRTILFQRYIPNPRDF